MGRRGQHVLAWTAGLAIAVVLLSPIVVRYLGDPPDQRLVDLDVYRTGGQTVLRGGRVYSVLTQPPQLLPFTYPPFAALLAIPLALLSWPVAQWAWTGVICLALTIAVLSSFAGLLRRAGRWAPLLGGALVGVCAQLMPVSDQFRFGQVDIVLVALCVADCAAVAPRWPRGLLVGLATAIKLVPGVFIVYLLITGRRQAAGNAVLTAGAATLGTFALLPRDSADFWFGAVLDTGRVGAPNGTTDQALRGMLLRLYWPGPVTVLLWSALLLTVGYLGFRLARRASLDAVRREAYSGELAGIAITGLLAVLLSPVAWIHHLCWLVPALGALLGSGRDPRRILVAGVVWLYYTLPLPWWGANLIPPHNPVLVRLTGRIVQDAYGLGAIVLIFVLGRRQVNIMGTNSQRHHVDASRADIRIGTLGS